MLKAKVEWARDIFDPLDDYRRVEIQIIALGILQIAQVFNLHRWFFFLFFLCFLRMICSVSQRIWIMNAWITSVFFLLYKATDHFVLLIQFRINWTSNTMANTIEIRKYNWNELAIQSLSLVILSVIQSKLYYQAN